MKKIMIFALFLAMSIIQISHAQTTSTTVPLVQASYWNNQPWSHIGKMPLIYNQEEDYCDKFEEYITQTFSVPQLSEIQEDECGSELIPVRDGLAIASDWLTLHDYFSVWDAKNLDSYNYNIKDFNEEIQMKLYDELQGQSWHAPIKPSKINSKYGMRRSRWHHGSDLDLEIGDSVFAVFDGIVRIAKVNRGGYGNYVLIRHKNGFETLYGHLDEYHVKEGMEVKAGELIGKGGNTGRSTGPHLHFEMRYWGHSIDPTHIFDFQQAKITTQDFTLTRNHFADYIKSLEAQYCRIRRGDCLSIIARRYGTSISRICRLNGISRRTILRVGRRLRVR